MNIRTLINCIIISAIIVMGFSASASATAFLKLDPSGGGGYTLQGVGIENVGGIQVIIDYDIATLGNPRVVMGSLASGAMNAVNTSVPGSINFGLISANRVINGSGTIATITFDRKLEEGGITRVVARLVDFTSNKQVPADARFSNPSVNRSATTDQSQSTNTTVTQTPKDNSSTSGVPVTPATTSTTARTGGTLTYPGDDSGSREKREVVAQENRDSTDTTRSDRQMVARDIVPPASENRDSESIAKKEETAQPATYDSVADRFRSYTGERTVKALTGLFAPQNNAPFVQEPAILLADGKVTLKVTIDGVAGKKSPNFALTGATLVTMKRKGTSGWIVEAKPQKGVAVASITMLQDGNMIEFPLTVAPKIDLDLDKSGNVNEADFLLFLKDRGTDKSPRFDLNGDGKRTYLDEYIYTANYLVDLQGQAAEKDKQGKAKTKGKANSPVKK
jgi:hypothetical protein